MTSNGAVAASSFAQIARGFCKWCEGGKATDLDAARWLALLHAEALALPEVGCENSEGLPDIPPADLAKAMETIEPFVGVYYREFFDPNPELTDESCIGDIGDDLLDVYKDIKGGLIVFDLGKAKDALWHWSFLHKAHWGRHATGALYALYCRGSALSEEPHAP